MKCQFCNSEWQSKYVIATCPFCGQKIIDDSADSFDTIVDSIYKAYGYEILKEKKKFMSLVLDLVMGFDKEKNLLKVLLSLDVNETIYDIIMSSQKDEKQVLYAKAIKKLTEEAFWAEENAQYIVKLLLKEYDVLEEKKISSPEKINNGRKEFFEKTKIEKQKTPAPKPSKKQNTNVQKKTTNKADTKQNNHQSLTTNYVGKRLDGRYEIQEIIGVGGMSVVYKAYDNVDDRIVAVKILKDEFLNNEEFKRRFKNVSKAITYLSHPNIVKVHDVSFGEKLLYIVMEYIDGITLKEYINKQGSITWNDALYFMTQILKAVQYAHDKGIVHGGIKSQNIILMRTGNVKVADFSIARFSKSETKIYTEQTIDLVHYISPEQAKGEFIDEKADIYSLGVVLYEMLSVAHMQFRVNAKKLTEINPNIPLGLEQICIHAMQKNPVDRYQTATEMLHDIYTVIKNPSITFKYSEKTNNENQKIIVSLRDYLLHLPEGKLTCNETLSLFLPFMDYLIENDIKKDIDIFPDTIYYVFYDNKLVLKRNATKGKFLGYSALETHKKGVRNETAIVYSIAACMYRTLVGRNPPSAVDRELGDKLLIPNEIAENIPLCVIRALAGALQIQSADRTKTISEFRQALSFEFENDKTKKPSFFKLFKKNSQKKKNSYFD